MSSNTSSTSVRRTAESKLFTEMIDKAYVAVVHDHVPVRDFFARAGTNCRCLERFVYVHLS